jgi:hypothetical protein
VQLSTALCGRTRSRRRSIEIAFDTQVSGLQRSLVLATRNNFLGTSVKVSTVTITKPMKPFAFAGVVLSLVWFSNAQAVDLANLKLLYVGEPTNSTRAKQVTSFLQKNVGRIDAVDRHGFKQDQATGFDVVMLDWPQSQRSDEERQQGSPLGPRTTWDKPTVLLGSAGLNMAIVWKVRGGSG